MRHYLFIFLLLCSYYPAFSQTPGYYFGSLHSHSEYSDGNQGNNPQYLNAGSCFEYANGSLHIDFWGISDHNHSTAGMQIADFHSAISEADSVNTDHDFITMYGIEYGTISAGGHLLVYGFDSLIGWETGNYDIYNAKTDYNGLFNLASAKGDEAFVMLCHMDSGDYGDLLNEPYNVIWDSAICGIALRNGPAFSQDTMYNDPPNWDYISLYNLMLAKGYHLGPGIDHDNHYINFGRSHQGRTVIISDSLTRYSLTQAIRRNRFYASDDWNAEVEFTVNSEMMGSRMNGNTNPVIGVNINDADAEIIDTIRIWYGVPGSNLTATVLYQATSSSSLQYTHSISAGTEYYYYAEIVQSDGDLIRTAPIWYNKSLSSSIEEIQLLTISISPNPVNSREMKIQTNGMDIRNVIITDMSGKLLKDYTLIPENDELVIDASFLAPGAYLLFADDKSGNIKRPARFIKL